MTKTDHVKKIALSRSNVSAISVALDEYAALNEGPMGSDLYAEELRNLKEQLKWAWAYGEDD